MNHYIETKDIKKGMDIMLTNGQPAKMMDNKRTDHRLVNSLSPIFNTWSLGEVHVSQIHSAKVNGGWKGIRFTDGQKKRIRAIRNSGF
jgi:hypothetical protein